MRELELRVFIGTNVITTFWSVSIDKLKLVESQLFSHACSRQIYGHFLVRSKRKLAFLILLQHVVRIFPYYKILKIWKYLFFILRISWFLIGRSIIVINFSCKWIAENFANNLFPANNNLIHRLHISSKTMHACKFTSWT